MSLSHWSCRTVGVPCQRIRLRRKSCSFTRPVCVKQNAALLRHSPKSSASGGASYGGGEEEDRGRSCDGWTSDRTKSCKSNRRDASVLEMALAAATTSPSLSLPRTGRRSPIRFAVSAGRATTDIPRRECRRRGSDLLRDQLARLRHLSRQECCSCRRRAACSA